jgi:RES domain-containing protein
VIWRPDATPLTDIAGRLWRMLAPRWAFDPLSGEGAARAGGRWNEPGQPALYLSEDHGTAVAEYQQDLARPGTLAAYDVDGSGIVDLTREETRRLIGVNDSLLRLPWKRIRDIERGRPLSWDFARSVLSAGCNGLRVPSMQSAGINVVLWRWNDGQGPRVRCLDPLGDLPEDQRSWPGA